MSEEVCAALVPGSLAYLRLLPSVQLLLGPLPLQQALDSTPSSLPSLLADDPALASGVHGVYHSAMLYYFTRSIL